MLYPMKLKAPLKDYIWGGTKLKTQYHKETTLPCIAESWELSCHPAGPSIIVNGAAAGMELSQYIAIEGERVVGAHAARYSFFPLLIKLIDAATDLSLQVHPDTEYALRVEGQYGKTEFWYVVDCVPGASLVCGFTRPVSKEEVRQRIADQTLLEICRRVPVRPGDVFYIPAGIIHSIGGGITLVEVQQTSDVTYRVYDYGRLGRDGKPRPLHVEKALDVLTLTPQPQPQLFPPMTFFSTYEMRMLAASEFFTVYHVHLHGRCSLRTDRQSFHSIVVIDGLLEIEYRSGVDYLEKGESLFVPADYGEYRLRGEGSFILSMVP
ncbi:MAG: type I phosphomannose isomerase catalytic subunit [Schwartzia sp. (in: firmicutes)]